MLTCSVIARCVQGAFSEIIDRWCPKEDIRSNQVAHCFLTHSQSWTWILMSAPAARRPKTSWSCAPWNQPLISNVDHYSSLMVAFLTYLQSCILCLANLEHNFGNLLPIFLQWTNWVDKTSSGVIGVLIEGWYSVVCRNIWTKIMKTKTLPDSNHSTNNQVNWPSCSKVGIKSTADHHSPGYDLHFHLATVRFA